MTTMQINAEIYRNLGYLADSDDYLSKALDFLKKLSRQKRKDAKAGVVQKIHVTDGPLPTDKYIGLFELADPKEDEKLKEEYMRQKYGMYLQ